MITPPTIPAPLQIYDDLMIFIEAVSELNLGMPLTAPTRAEIDPTLALLKGVTINRLVDWLRPNLHSPAHLLLAEAPEHGDRHQIEFEDILDGEAFRRVWRHVCEPFGADLASTPPKAR
jgi:hypothetical protein